ncbi:MAG: DNA cytosine methyltransferase [Nitrososphaera sp.]
MDSGFCNGSRTTFLDLFCGRGGASKGFAAEGFACTGVDIRNIGYPFNFIKADLFDYMPGDRYTVIWASPPCSMFSRWTLGYIGKAVPHKGLDLIWRAFHIIQTCKPRYWILENVAGLAGFIGRPNTTVKYQPRGGSKVAYLWGQFPPLGLIEPIARRTTRADFIKNPDILAEIPIELSRAIAKAIKEDMLKNSDVSSR